jgi:predicted nucleic acid-binding protein
LRPSATRVVVADAGPLIALGRLDILAVLANLFEQVQVPELVLAECLVLVRAKRKGLVPEVRTLIDRLRASGHHLGDAVVAEALSAAGEAPASR